MIIKIKICLLNILRKIEINNKILIKYYKIVKI